MPDPGASAPKPTSRGQQTYQIRRNGEEIEILVRSEWRCLHRESDVYKSADAQLRVLEEEQKRQAPQVHPSDVTVAGG